MIADRTDARDRMLTPLKAIVDAQSLYTIYDDTRKELPDGSTSWVRIAIRHQSGSRSSLGNSSGKAKHTQAGIILIELNTPREEGLANSDIYSAAFADALRNFSDGDIWISDVNVLEIGEDGNWFEVNIIADFQYDLIR